MRYITKYTVGDLGTDTELLLDEHAEILDVGIEYDSAALVDVVVFWAFNVDGAPTTPRTFRAIGTGWEVPEDGVHVGTAKQGFIERHLIERTKED